MKETYLLTKTFYTKHIYTTLMLYTGIKNIDGKFLHDMLVNWLYGGIRTLLFLWWTITVESVLKGTCIEIPPVYKDHQKFSLNKQFIPTKRIHVFLWLLCLKKMRYPIPKNLWCKKGKAKKVQVTKRL